MANQNKPKSGGINYRGVEEGGKFNFYGEEINFAYNDQPIKLYEDPDGEEVEFQHFANYSPKCEQIAFFNFRLLHNLDNIGIFTMRPTQVASMMATFYDPPANLQPPDLLCISSTGSGKSLAFLVPMIQKCMDRIQNSPSESNRTPMVLIFAQSKTLVGNLYQTATKLVEDTNVKVKLIAGETVYLRSTNFDIGICTIGRFKNHFENDSKNIYKRIDISALEYLIIDEADLMANEPEFREIVKKMKEKKNFTTFCYSATIGSSIYDFVDQKNYYAFGGGKINEVASSIKTYFWEINSKSNSRITGAYKGKLHFAKYKPDEIQHPFDALFVFLKENLFNTSENKKKIMVFVKRTAVADLLALRLSLYGFPAVSVHGKLNSELRDKFLQEFIDGESRICFATNLLTRGTDVDVDFVINYDLPLDYEQWVHRCGRTGRNGNIGVAITFVDMKNDADYPKLVIQKIATKVEKSRPKFMRRLAEIAKKEKDANTKKLENEDYGI